MKSRNEFANALERSEFMIESKVVIPVALNHFRISINGERRNNVTQRVGETETDNV